jgi:hypothetical protein
MPAELRWAAALRTWAAVALCAREERGEVRVVQGLMASFIGWRGIGEEA